jgi:hypothetical protein
VGRLRSTEDFNVYDVPIPVTTNPAKLVNEMSYRKRAKDAPRRMHASAKELASQPCRDAPVNQATAIPAISASPLPHLDRCAAAYREEYGGNEYGRLPVEPCSLSCCTAQQFDVSQFADNLTMNDVCTAPEVFKSWHEQAKPRQ